MTSGNLELQVFAYNDPTKFLDILPGRTVPVFLDEMKQQGAGSFTISKSDQKVLSNPHLLDYRNVIKAVRDGRVEGAMIVGSKQDNIIDSDEVNSKTVEVSGEGLKGWFRDAVVYPFRPLTAKSSDTRIFNWAAPRDFDYVQAGFVNAYNIANYELVPPKGSINPWKYKPAEWPDCPQAKWVWGRPKPSSKSFVQPIGYNYFRYDFNISAGNAARGYSLFCAADDNFVAYLDGEEIITSDPNGASTTYRYDIDAGTLQAGNHTIGVRVYNGKGNAAMIASFWMQGVASQNLKASLLGYTGQPSTTYLAAQAEKANTLLQSKINQLKSLGITKLSPVNTVKSKLAAAQKEAARVVKSRTASYNKLPAKPASRKTQSRNNLKVSKADLTLKTSRVAWFNAYISALSRRNAAQATYNKARAQGTLGWTVSAYPAQEPGWTAGGVILSLINEAKDRGVRSMGWLTPTFTNAKDSSGVAWDKAIPWSFNLGDDYLTVFQQMEELGCDIWINPDSLELNAYASRGTDRSFQNGTKAPVILQEGKNLTKAGQTGTSDIKNTLIVNTNDGWLERRGATASTGLYGRLEGTFATGAPSNLTTQLVDLALATNESEQVSATYEIIPLPGITPIANFQTGDWVLAPDRDGNLVKRRVMSISTTETSDSGRPAYVLEFDTIFQTEDNLLTQWLARVAGGALSLSYQNAGLPKSIPGKNSVNPISSSAGAIPAAPANVRVTSVGAWKTQTAKPVAKMSVLWEPVTTTDTGDDLVDVNDDTAPVVVSSYRVFAETIPDVEDDNDDPTPVPVDDGTEPGDSTPDDDYTGGTDDMFPDGDPDTTVVTGPLTLLATVDGSVTSADIEVDPNTVQNYYVQAVVGTDASAISDPLTFATDSPEGEDTLAAPSAPTLTSDLGTVTATWDGLFTDTSDYAPNHFSFMTLWMSTSATGNFSQVGNPLTDQGDIIVPKLTVGSTYYFYFAATDISGTLGDPSAVRSVAVKGIAALDLDQEIQDRIDAANATAASAQTTASNANTAAGNAQTAADNANTAALNAAGIANGKGKVIYQQTAPTGANANVNNLWIRTTDNVPFTYDGTNWNARTDATATKAAQDAASALTAAQNAATAAQNAATAAGNAQATANGKNEVFYQATAPAGNSHADGDIWFNTSAAAGNAISTWNGTTNAWELKQFSTGALAVGAITAQSGIIGSLDASVITSGYLDVANRIQSKSITASQIIIQASQTQLLQSPGFEAAPYFIDPTLGGYVAGTDYAFSTIQPHSGTTSFATYPTGTSRIFQGSQAIPCIPGEVYKISYWECNTSDYVPTSGNGVTIRDSASAGNALGTLTHGTNTGNRIWNQYSITFTVPAGVTQFWIQIRATNAVGSLLYDDFSLTCLTPGGSLIVDGEITSQKLTVGAVKANNIDVGAVTANSIAAGAIDGKLITGATIQTAATGARLTFSGSTILGYSAATGSPEFFRVSTTGGGLIQMTNPGYGTQTTVTIKGTTWNGGGIVFLNKDITASGAPLSAPGVGWFVGDQETGGDHTPTIVFGSPNTGSAKFGPSYAGMGIDQYGDTILHGGPTGSSTLYMDDNSVSATVGNNFSYNASLTLGPTVEPVGANDTGAFTIYSDYSPVINYIYANSSSLVSRTLNSTNGTKAELNMNQSGALNLIITSSSGTVSGLTLRSTAGVTNFAGTIEFTSQVTVSGNYNATVTGRTMVMRSDGLIGYTPSTRKDKYAVETIEFTPDKVATAMSIPSRTFLANYDFRQTPQRQGGFFAEDFHEAGWTEYVDYGSDDKGEMTDVVEGLSYDRIPSLLWAWNQAMQTQINSLLSEIEDLKKTNG